MRLMFQDKPGPMLSALYGFVGPADAPGLPALTQKVEKMNAALAEIGAWVKKGGD